MDEYEFNPCFCISVRTGSLIISIFDMIYGIIYIGRVLLLKNMIESYPYAFLYILIFYMTCKVTTIFRQIYKNSSQSNDTLLGFIATEEVQSANYGVMLISGIGLWLATKVISEKGCYAWLVARLYLTVVFSVVVYMMYDSSSSANDSHHVNYMYITYGTEVLFNLLIHIYFFVIVFIFSKEIRTQARIAKMSVQSRKNIMPHMHATKINKVIHPSDIMKMTMDELTPQVFLEALNSNDVKKSESKQNFLPRKNDYSDEDWTENRYRDTLSKEAASRGMNLNPLAFKTSTTVINPKPVTISLPVLKMHPPTPTVSTTKTGTGVAEVTVTEKTKGGPKRRITFSEPSPSKIGKDDAFLNALIVRNPAASKFRQLYMDNEFIVIKTNPDKRS